MAQSTTLRLRGYWLQIHKWIGLLLAILIIPISLSGAALVWHDALDEALNPARYAVSAWRVALPPGEYEKSARPALDPGQRIVAVRYPAGDEPVVVVADRPPRPDSRPGARPQRTNAWMDPATGRLLDSASADAGAVRVLHRLHGSLTVPGVGRQIVGWIGVAMLISSLTGLWLWWPLRGSWRRGLRWRRQNATSANLHHLTGFWICVPLAMLSFTGAWISFPQFFGQLSGAAAQRPPAAPTNARPVAEPVMSPNEATGIARAHSEGRLLLVTWPTERDGRWKVSYQREGGNAEVGVDDATKKVTPPKPPRPEPIARTMRRWHDGTGMGAIWQAIIFLGGIAPALLAITGIIMWLRSRGWRSRLRERRKSGRMMPIEGFAE